MLKNPNQHILSYLDYYASHMEPPGYAFMITGAWGSGKTWLIRQHISTDTAHKYLYVSLYGAKNADEVAERIFAARHPILTSKGAVIAGRLVKGLVKFTTSIDLNSDKKDDLQVSLNLPDVTDVAKVKSALDDCILVFDDVERCPADGNQLWGFMNQLVEHEGARVILLSCEDEIERRDDSYRRTKEKNIGMTMSIIPDAAGALEGLIGDDAAHAEVLRTHRERILQMFEYSGCASLRVLRFAIRDFCRVFAEVPSHLQKESKVVLKLLDSTLPLAFGVYSGEIKPDQIVPVSVGLFMAKQNEEQALTKVGRKYPGFSLYASIPSRSWWRSFFSYGEIQRSDLIDACESLVSTAHQPSWLRLAQFDNLSDSEFESLLEDTWQTLVSNGLHAVGPILHVAATHMWAIGQGVVASNRTLLLVQDSAKDAIDALDNDAIVADLKEGRHEGILYACANISYAAGEMPEFRALVDHVCQIYLDTKKAMLRLEAERVLKEMRCGGGAFAAALGIGLAEDDNLENFASSASILAEVEIGEFVRALLSLAYRDQIQIVEALHRRLKRGLPEERDWVKRMTVMLDEQPGPSLQKHMLFTRLSHSLR